MKPTNILVVCAALLISPISAKSILDKNLTDLEIQEFAHPNISGEWVEGVGTWYVPLISLDAAVQMREMLTGKNVSTGTGDWDDFCLREVWADPIAILKGFNESQPSRCNLDANYFGTCTYWTDKSDSAQKATIFMTHTDNASYLLEVRVWKNERRNDWLVFSKFKNLSQDTINEVMKGVQELGFNSTDSIRITYEYDKCSV